LSQHPVTNGDKATTHSSPDDLLDRRRSSEFIEEADDPLTPEIGHFALALALAMALVQSVLPILGAGRGNILWMQSARWSSFGQVFFVGIAFLAIAIMGAGRFSIDARRP
jgi:hypothetical protein